MQYRHRQLFQTTFLGVLRSKICVVLVCLVVLFQANGADKESDSPDSFTDIVAVDMDRLMIESKRIAALRASVEAIRQRFEKDIFGRQESLVKRDRELDNTKTTTPADEFERKMRSFHHDVKDLNTLAEKRRQYLDTVEQSVKDKIDERIKSIIQTIRSKNNYKLVIKMKSVLDMEPEMDITADVLKAVDKQPLTIDFPKEPS